jgi:hypothetical protein
MSDQVFAACTEKTMPIAPDIAEHILVNLARFEIEAFECTRAAAPYRSADVAHADLQTGADLTDLGPDLSATGLVSVWRPSSGLIRRSALGDFLSRQIEG